MLSWPIRIEPRDKVQLHVERRSSHPRRCAVLKLLSSLCHRYRHKGRNEYKCTQSTYRMGDIVFSADDSIATAENDEDNEDED